MDCSIRIYDPEFNRLAVAEQAESVIFTRNLYGVGSFSIKIHPDKAGADSLSKHHNIIMINRDKSKSGIVRDFEISGGREGESLTVYGVTGSGFLARRRVEPPKNQAYDSFTGAAETVLKHYVSAHIINPTEANRRISGIEIAHDNARGKEVSASLRYTNLAEDLAGIAEYAELGQEIYADTANKKWVYDIIDGKDLTTAQHKNSPVRFTVEQQNISDYRYVENYSNYAATGYAGGAGYDTDRIIEVVGNEAAGRDRYETFIDCGSYSGEELTNFGRLRLYDFKAVKTIEASALPRGFIFGRDYTLGDKVTLYISRLGLTVHTYVTEVSEIWECESGYRAEIRFGDKVPNIFTVLQNGRVVN